MEEKEERECEFMKKKLITILITSLVMIAGMGAFLWKMNAVSQRIEKKKAALLQEEMDTNTKDKALEDIDKLELRQKISEVYGRYEAYVRICTKCLLAFLVFYMIHSQLSGSMNPRSWAEIVVATLIAVMIPIDACSILVAIFVIVHMLMISVEAGVIAAEKKKQEEDIIL